MSRIPMFVVAAAVSLSATVAAADDSDPSPLAQAEHYHVDGGAEVTTDGKVTSFAFRGQALYGTTFGVGAVRPELAAGMVFGAGNLYVPDPRGVDGTIALNEYDGGPALQAGFQFFQQDVPTVRPFATLAYLRVGLDHRLMVDPIPGVGGSSGYRLAFGANWMREISVMKSYSRDEVFNVLAVMLLPHQVEFTVDHDAGSTRYGATLSWGI